MSFNILSELKNIFTFLGHNPSDFNQTDVLLVFNFLQYIL